MNYLSESKPVKEQKKPVSKILPGITIPLKGLTGVMSPPEESSEGDLNTANAIEGSGRWPLLIDEQERAATFLRYRNVNYLAVMNSNDMEPERIRLALLGGIRYAIHQFFLIDNVVLVSRISLTSVC